MKAALYARVSTDDKNQDPETQLYAMREFCDNAGWSIIDIYIDRARAKDHQRRTEWARLQKDARQRKFKIVLVLRLDRAFRSVRECCNCLEDWHDIGIGFKSLQDGAIDTSNSQGRFILHIMSAVAELESSIIGDRVKAGMARAKSQGKVLGRRSLSLTIDDIFASIEKNQTISAAARELKCSRASIHKRLKKHSGIVD